MDQFSNDALFDSHAALARARQRPTDDEDIVQDADAIDWGSWDFMLQHHAPELFDKDGRQIHKNWAAYQAWLKREREEAATKRLPYESALNPQPGTQLHTTMSQMYPPRKLGLVDRWIRRHPRIDRFFTTLASAFGRDALGRSESETDDDKDDNDELSPL